jgi:hypothetical protein
LGEFLEGLGTGNSRNISEEIAQEENPNKNREKSINRKCFGKEVVPHMGVFPLVAPLADQLFIAL